MASPSRSPGRKSCPRRGPNTGPPPTTRAMAGMCSNTLLCLADLLYHPEPLPVKPFSLLRGSAPAECVDLRCGRLMDRKIAPVARKTALEPVGIPTAATDPGAGRTTLIAPAAPRTPFPGRVSNPHDHPNPQDQHGKTNDMAAKCLF